MLISDMLHNLRGKDIKKTMKVKTVAEPELKPEPQGAGILGRSRGWSRNIKASASAPDSLK
jgi:hypothetical protein